MGKCGWTSYNWFKYLASLDADESFLEQSANDMKQTQMNAIPDYHQYLTENCSIVVLDKNQQ